MKKLIVGVWVGLMGILSGCGGGTIDDTLSTYEPTVTINETVVDEADYKFVITELVQKTHPDVGRIIEISIDAENKTDEKVYITLENLHFDGDEISVVHLAFFNELQPQTSSSEIIYVQQMEDKELQRIESNFSFTLQVVNDDGSEVLATYPVDITF